MLKFLGVGTILTLFIASILFWKGNIASTLQSVESIIRPVFHKDTINYYAGIYKDDPLFIAAIIKVESNFFWRAKSPRGALGLMQVMPATGKEIASELKIRNFEPESLHHPRLNIQFGTHYISKLRKEFGDQDITVLAAYNGGKKNVKDWLDSKQKTSLDSTDILFPETKNFVTQVLRTYHWLKKIQKWRNKILNVQPGSLFKLRFYSQRTMRLLPQCIILMTNCRVHCKAEMNLQTHPPLI